MLASAALAQSESSANIQQALDEMKSTSQMLLGVGIMVSLVFSIPLVLMGALIYIKKLKHVEKRKGIWIALALLFGGIGGLLLLGAIIGLLIYIFTPLIIDMMVGPVG